MAVELPDLTPTGKKLPDVVRRVKNRMAHGCEAVLWELLEGVVSNLQPRSRGCYPFGYVWLFGGSFPILALAERHILCSDPHAREKRTNLAQISLSAWWFEP